MLRASPDFPTGTLGDCILTQSQRCIWSVCNTLSRRYVGGPVAADDGQYVAVKHAVPPLRCAALSQHPGLPGSTVHVPLALFPAAQAEIFTHTQDAQLPRLLTCDPPHALLPPSELPRVPLPVKGATRHSAAHSAAFHAAATGAARHAVASSAAMRGAVLQSTGYCAAVHGVLREVSRCGAAAVVASLDDTTTQPSLRRAMLTACNLTMHPTGCVPTPCNNTHALRAACAPFGQVAVFSITESTKQWMRTLFMLCKSIPPSK